MRSLPDRLGQAIERLERGERVDWQTLSALQALDIVRFGRQIAEDAIKEQEQADERAADAIRSVARG